MTTVFGKEERDFLSAYLIPHSVKRRVALEKWIKSTSLVIQAAVSEELRALVESITESRWTEEGWRAGARKLRQIQNEYHIVLDIKFRRLASNEKYTGEIYSVIVPKTEIDLHEKKVHEAIPLVEKYLQESYDACLLRVRIIHGKGIGVLRQAIRDYLQNHRLVKSFATADKDHGGDGATEVEIMDIITD